VFGNHSTGEPNRAGSNLPRDHCRCPVPARDDAWRWLTAKRFCGNGLASLASAKRFSSFARTAIAGIAIAVMSVAIELAAGNGSSPTGATNAAARAASIIAIASGSTGAAFVNRDRA